MKRTFITMLVVAIILGLFALPVQADGKQGTIGKDVPEKAARGAKNLVLGWTEIPNTIVSVTKDTKNPLIGLTVGTVKGILNAFARTTSGAVDVVTSPSGNKGPDMKTQMVNPGTVFTTPTKETVKMKDIK